jgi:hypothetical protein
VRVNLILNAEGSIVGTIPSGVQEVNQIPKKDGPSEEVTQVEIRVVPQSGQTVHEVELPPELEALSGVELQNAVIGYQIKTEEARLVQRSS